MKTRLLLVVFVSLLLQEVQAQVKSPLQALRKVSLFSENQVLVSKKSLVKGEIVGTSYASPDARDKSSLSHLYQGPSRIKEVKEQVDRAYASLSALSPNTILSGSKLSGQALKPGVYRITGDALLKGKLELIGTGKPSDSFVFQVEGDLSVSPSSMIELKSGAKAASVYWQVVGNTEIGARSNFKGTVLSQGDITAEKGAIFHGGLLSKKGKISLTDVSSDTPPVADLAITQAVSAGPYVVGNNVSYTITVTNSGPDNEQNVYVNFGWLPSSGLITQSATPSTGTYTAGDWNIPVLNVGDVATLTVVLKINRSGFITTVGTATGTGADENLDNNTSEFSICAVQPPGDITGPTALCINTTGPDYVFTIPAAAGAKGYAWVVPADWTILTGANTNSITVRTGSSGGTKTVSVRIDSPCGFGPQKSISVDMYTAQPVLIGSIIGESNICVNTTGKTYSITGAVTGLSHEWSVPAGWSIVFGQGTSQIEVAVPTGAVSGDVQVKAINPCGESNVVTKAVEITNNAPSTPGEITGPVALCENQAGTVTYSVAMVTDAKSYTWTLPADWTVVGDTDKNSITAKVGLLGGTVSVVANNVCGSSAAAATLEVVTAPAAPVAGSIIGDRTICSFGGATTYSINPVANAGTYTWTVPAGWTITGGQGTTAITVQQNASSGTVAVRVANGCGFDDVTASVTVSTFVPGAAPEILTNLAGTLPCVGQAGLVYSVDDVAGAQVYTWSFPSDWVITAGQGTKSVTVTAGSLAGQVEVRASNGCGAGPATTLNVTPAPSAPATPVTILGEDKPCVGNEETYSVETPVALVYYNWSFPGNWTILEGQGTSTVKVKVGTDALTATVIATNGCGDSAPAALVLDPFNGLPVFPGEIQDPGLICLGTPEITYFIDAATEAGTYTWAVPSDWTILSGQGTNEIKVKPGTSNGQVRVYAQNTCGTSAVKVLNETISPAAPATPGAIAGVASVCASQAPVTFSVAPVANATSYNWVLPTDWTVLSGNNTNEITVKIGTTTGTNTVSVSAANSCGPSPATSLTVNVTGGPVAAGAISGIAEVCGTNTEQVYSISPVAGATGYTWTLPAGWTYISGQNTTSLRARVGATGTISVTVQNVCGTGTASTRTTLVSTVIPPAPTAINAGPNATNPCFGQTGLTYSITPVAGATSYVWTVPTTGGWAITNGQGSTSIVVTAGNTLAAGQVSVIARNACGNSTATSINVAPSGVTPVQPSPIIGETVPCIGPGEIVYRVQTPVAGVDYNWIVPGNWTLVSGNGTSEIRVKVGSDAGNVSVTASNGCGVSPATTLAVAPANGPPVIAGAITGQDDVCVGAVLTYTIPASAAVSSYNWTVPSNWAITSGAGTNTIQVTVNGVSTGFVRVTAVNGCGDSNTEEIAVVSSPNSPEEAPLISGPQELCVGNKYTFTVADVDHATGYQWNVPPDWIIVSGQGTGTLVAEIGPSSGGVYVLKAKAVNGCGGSDESVFNTIVFPSVPSPVGTITGDVKVCGMGAEYTYSVPSVNYASTYAWILPADWTLVSGQNTNSITVRPGTQSGNIRLMVSNACGFSTTEGNLAVTVVGSVPPMPDAISGSPFASIPCLGQMGITYTINAITGADSYIWNVPGDWTITSGQGTTSITVTAGSEAGNVSVKASNLCGEGAARTFTVNPLTTVPPAPAGITGLEKPCATSKVTYSVTAPGSGLEYNWSVPAGWNIDSGQGTSEVVVTIGTTAGAISVAARNGCGEGAAFTRTISPRTGAPTLATEIQGEPLVCGGTSGLIYTIDAVTTADSYNWDVPSGWTITAGQGTNSITVTAGASSGVVSVAGVNTCGEGVRKQLTVTTTPVKPEDPDTISGPSALCVGGGPVTFSIDPVALASTYTWAVPAGWTILGGQGTVSLQVQPDGTSGAVTVTAANFCGTGTATKTVTISSTIPAAPGVIAGNNNYCASGEAVTYSISPVAGALSYNWSIPAGWTLVSGQGSTSVSVIPTTNSGDISVVASNGCGTSTASSRTITITGLKPATPGPIAGPTAPCDSHTVTYTIDPVPGAEHYVWTLPDGWLIEDGHITNTITVLVGSTNGNITVKAASSICGDSQVRTLAVVSSKDAPAIPVGINGQAIPCIGQNVTYTVASPVAGLTYTWSVPTGWAPVSGQGTASFVVKAGSTAGNISVTASNGCGTSTAAVLAVTPANGAPALVGNINGQINVCANTSYTYTVNGSNASSFNWTVPTGWNITAGQGTNTITVTTGATPGTVSVEGSNGCGVSTNKTLAVTVRPPAPATPGTITGNANVCAGQSIAYAVDAVPNATTYVWSVPPGATITNGHGTNSITVQLGSTSGQVTARAQNACGTSTASSLAITVSPAGPGAIGSIAGATAVCAGSVSQTYSVNPVAGASTYAWTFPAGWNVTSGQGSESVTVQPGTIGGNATLVASNPCGQVTRTFALTIEQPFTSAPSDLAGKSSPCIGEENLTYSITAVAGATGYTWNLPADWAIVSGNNTRSIVVKAGATSGTVSVTANNVCGASPAAVLNVTPTGTAPTQPVGIAGNLTPCTSSVQTYSVQSPVGGLGYTWTLPAGWSFVSGQGSSQVVVNVTTTGGNLSVVATNVCGTSTARTIAINPTGTPPVLTQVQGRSTVCASETQIVYSVTTTTAPNTYQWTVPTGWTITNGQGTAQITVNPGATGGTISVTGTNTCGTDDAALAVTVAPGLPADPGPITGLDQYCASSTTYTYTIDAVPGASSYAWNVPSGWTLVSGQGSRTIQIKPGNTSGVISVNTVNGCGNSAGSSTKFVTITGQAPDAPVAITGTTAPCIGQTNVIYTINPVSGAASYAWSVPAGWTIMSGQGSTSLTVTVGSTVGNVSVRAASATCGNSNATNLLVTPFANPPAQPDGIQGEATPCVNADVTYTITNPVAGLTYNWTLPTGWSVVSGAGTESVVVKVGSNSGNIRVTASNDCGTSSSIARVVTPTTGNATMSAIAGAANVCPDATGLIYSVTPSAGISGYQWTVPAGWAIESGQGTAQITVTAPASGSGNLVVNAVNECNVPVSRSIVVAVTSGAPLAIQDIVGEANVCATQEYTYSVPVVTGATLYTWTVPVGATVISGAGTSAITVRMGMSAGQVAVFASNNCSTSPTKQFAVNTPGTEPEAISGITGAAAVCSSDPSRTYTIGNVAGATGYTWSVPSGWTILAGQGTLSLTVKPGLLGGNLKVDASNACGTTSSTMAVTVTQPIAGLSDISGTQVPCENQSGLTYSITPVAGANYTWTVPGGWTITSGQNTASIQVQAGSAAGQITVKATNLCGDSPMSTLDVSTMQQKPDAPTALSGEATPCIGAPGITYAIQAPVTGLTYNWTLPTGWTLVSGQGTSTISVNIGATAGNISVTASNGCGTSDAFAFAVAPTVGTPAITGDMEGTSTLCGGATPLVYKVTGTAGATYTWTVPTGWTILTGQNTPQIEVTAGTTGGTVSVTGNNGCGTITRTMSVTVQTPITGTLSAITGKATPCQAEENLVYSVNTLANATTYTWQVPTGWTIVSGQNTNTITVKAGTGAGTIRVTASNTCGDSQPAELQVAPTAAPDAPLAIAGGVQPCPNALQVQYGVASAIPGVTYNWSVPAGWTLVSGQGGATILVNVGTTDGTISVTASNNCGTSAVTSRFITLGAPAPVITTEIQGNAAVCANTAATTYEIAPVTGATAYTWSVPAGWTISSGQGGTTITVQVGTASGEVKVVASNGCGTGTKIMNVTVTPDVLAAPVAINGNLTVCPATSNLIYSVQAVSGATSYNWAVPTGWTIISGQGTASIRVQSGTTDGQITVSAVGTCATSATTSLSVQVTGPAPALGNIAGTATVCEDAVVMYEVAPVTGVTTYQWSLPAGWSFISGQGTNSISVRTGTTGGTVSVSSANACFTNPTPKTYAVVVSGSRPAKPGTITPSVAIPCSNQPGLVYTVAAVPGATGYVWSVPAGWTITAGGTTNTITVLSGTGTGNITVKATNTCGESAVESMSVTATPALGTVGDIKNETDVCAGYQFSIDPVTGADPNGYVWSAPAGWTIITGQGTTRVTMKADKPITNSEIISVYASNGACTTVAKTFEVLPGQVGVEDDMNVPNAFSPNNDGKNDVWVVRGLLNYADNELVVVNRWGSEVFRQKGYANNWDGKGLAEGTYYYILKVRLCNNREVTYKGFVMLTR